MSAPAGYIELERTVDSIIVGRRHREDLGDLDPLVESIRRDGLLQPITITLDGHLICGARRLAALKLLGIKTVNVWVRSGISDRLGQLLAEQDENVLHKPLTQLEAAALYRELKTLLAEDAARRQEATRFQTTADDAEDGGANLAPPQFEQGKARAQAARMVTGRASYTTLERIGRLEDLAADESQPEPVKEKTDDVPLNLETARRFAVVLQQEKQLMQDAQGREELDHMQTTTTAICDWLEAHPESLPKARRFAEYYIPTTLKLLHTYNDVQGQQGENAETIRRDIAGILHTLNQAYSNLYDNLLSDVAMDVSSEIAALQGMLANDGLTGEGLL